MNKLGQMKLDALERFATSFRADFRFSPLNIMILITLCLLGLVIHLTVYPFSLETVITMPSRGQSSPPGPRLAFICTTGLRPGFW